MTPGSTTRRAGRPPRRVAVAPPAKIRRVSLDCAWRRYSPAMRRGRTAARPDRSAEGTATERRGYTGRRPTLIERRYREEGARKRGFLRNEPNGSESKIRVDEFVGQVVRTFKCWI